MKYSFVAGVPQKLRRAGSARRYCARAGGGVDLGVYCLATELTSEVKGGPRGTRSKAQRGARGAAHAVIDLMRQGLRVGALHV